MLELGLVWQIWGDVTLVESILRATEGVVRLGSRMLDIQQIMFLVRLAWLYCLFDVNKGCNLMHF